MTQFGRGSERDVDCAGESVFVNEEVAIGYILLWMSCGLNCLGGRMHC